MAIIYGFAIKDYLARAKGPQFLVGFSWKRVKPEGFAGCFCQRMAREIYGGI